MQRQPGLLRILQALSSGSHAREAPSFLLSRDRPRARPHAHHRSTHYFAELVHRRMRSMCSLLQAQACV